MERGDCQALSLRKRMGVEGGRDMGLSAMSLCTLHPTLCFLHPCTVHAAPHTHCTLHRKPFPQYPTPHTVHTAPPTPHCVHPYTLALCTLPLTPMTVSARNCTAYHTVLSESCNIEAALWTLKYGFGILYAVSLPLGLHPVPSTL